jgi:hypothetical protein
MYQTPRPAPTLTLRYLFKDHSKHCAARFNRQFVALSEIGSFRMGEFTGLSAKAPIAPRDFPQF